MSSSRVANLIGLNKNIFSSTINLTFIHNDNEYIIKNLTQCEKLAWKNMLLLLPILCCNVTKNTVKCLGENYPMITTLIVTWNKKKSNIKTIFIKSDLYTTQISTLQSKKTKTHYENLEYIQLTRMYDDGCHYGCLLINKWLKLRSEYLFYVEYCFFINYVVGALKIFFIYFLVEFFIRYNNCT